MYEVIMPKLGITMESGIIEKWHKKEGDERQRRKNSIILYQL